MSNYPKNSNPFEEEEIDDFTFITKSGSRQPENLEYGQQRSQLWEDANASEDRQLDSTRRTLASMYDSERIGVATAEELVRQGEVLDNVETKTTGINQNLKTTQKHLNSVKSVFGGIKNWWNGTPTSNAPREPVNSPRKLKETLEQRSDDSSSSTSHTPNLRSRDVGGFYDDKDIDSQFLSGSNKQRMFEPVTRSSRETEIDENLGMMSDGMSRLRGLAMGLGNEIDAQSEQLDRINRKVDIADHNIDNQNKQMRKILK